MSSRNTILFILISYMVINLVIGILLSRKSSKLNASKGFLQNYFIGGRSVGGVVLAMTLIATYTSASSFLGGPGLCASFGLTQVWVAAIQIGTAFLTLGIVGKKLGVIGRRIHAVSISDYLRARYNSKAVVILSSVALIIFFMTQMVAQFMGGATLLEAVTGLPYQVGLLIFAVVVVAYTAIGGFKAVVITDTIQGFIMLLGTFLMIFFVISAGGGMENLVTQLDSINPGWDVMGKGEFGEGIRALTPGFLMSYWVLVGIAILALPQTAVRGLSFKDTKSLHRAMLYGTVTVGIIMIGVHFVGVISAPLLPEGGVESTDRVIPYIVLNYMPTWAAGIFLAAPLAAIMSTVDSLLILASATIIKDLYLNYFAKEKVSGNDNESANTKALHEDKHPRLSLYSFLLTLLIGGVVFIFALNPPSIIVWINLFALGGLEATFFWPLIGGLYWKKGNSAAALSSTIVSLAVFIFFNQFKVLPFGVHEIVLALIVGGIVYFLVGSMSKAAPDRDMLEKCF